MDVFVDPQKLQDFISGFGIWAPLAFFALQLIQVVLAPIPGNVSGMVGGMILGFWEGFLISYAAVTVGSLLCFLFARKVGRGFLQKRLKRFEKYDKLLSSEGASARLTVTVALIFLLPFLPDDLVCLLVGLTPLRFRTFVVITLLTRPWGLAVSSFVGAQSFSMPLWLLITLAVVMLAIGVAAVRFAPQLERLALGILNKIKSRTKDYTNIK